MNDEHAMAADARVREAAAVDGSGSSETSGPAPHDDIRNAGSLYVRLGEWDAETRSWSFDLVALSAVQLTALHVGGQLATKNAWAVDVEHRRVFWRARLLPDTPDGAYVSVVSVTAPSPRPSREGWWLRKDVLTIAGLILAAVPATIAAYYGSAQSALLRDERDKARSETTEVHKKVQDWEGKSALCATNVGRMVKLCTAAEGADP